MGNIYLIIVVVLLLLAALDLSVGVANDAVNFLNSSIGSRVAPLWVILTVASIGVLVGSLFSSGMMEIARSGIFNPHMINFPNVMLLFLAVMITDVILLDVFNTFGLPTSTTVSLVFELLGAAVAVALFMIWKNNPDTSLAEYINSSKALAIISGIFISIIIAFVCGTIVMFISRLIFSFNYQKVFKYLGAIWGGIALTAITYFAIFKGLKGSVLISDSFNQYLTENMGMAILYAFLGWTVLMAIMQHLFRLNILRFIVLAGTCALAMSFAGNDLVNFIGVPLAGLSSYHIGLEHIASGGSLDTLYLGKLAEPVVADWRYLLGAGILMVSALWFSKKSRTVTDTEVNLARQGGGIERFSSTALSRSIVRGSIQLSRAISSKTPKKIKDAIDSRFKPLENVPENAPPFDLLRASVNLTIGALLISLGTSLKLPLSTTYVTFMVAMGTSLADRAWGRESAVYRITGVLTVIGGWFLTAIIAFSVAFIVALILTYGGKTAIFIMLAVVVLLLIQSSIVHKRRKEKESKQKAVLDNEHQIIELCTNEVQKSVQDVMYIYQQTLDGLLKEDRRNLSKVSKKAKNLHENYRIKRSYEVVPTIETIQINELDIEQEYVQIIDYTYEITKALKIVTESSLEHISNNHVGFSESQVQDLKLVAQQVTDIYGKFIGMVEQRDYSDFGELQKQRDGIIELCGKLTKKQIKRVKSNESGTRNTILFLHVLNETKYISLQSSNLMKSQRNMMEISRKNNII
ncbi:MAG: inorganic phosphate transporter [Bacteroidales bacterium]|jgi:phosphate/sulfate permease